MATTMIRRGGNSRVRRQAENGFSLLEVVISMAVLTVGMVSLLGVFGLAMASTQTSQQDMIAKQLANEAYESIVTARNTTQITWDDIQNQGSTTCTVTGASSCGIFASPTSPLPMYTAITTGTYAGILGTTYDVGQPEQTLQDPGPDGVYQTADDILIPLTGYTRTILISPVYDSSGNLVGSLRAVTITISYSTTQTQLPKSYILNSYISEYQ
jgi:prepilin-type N-terminal cleavage/methylation domain-containing protein